MNYDSGFLIEVKNTLVTYFDLTTEDEQFEVITHIPNAIYESQDINSILEATKLKAFCDQRGIDFSEWIAEFPLLLMMDLQNILERCDSELPDYFGSKKEVSLAIKTMPSILTAHWPDLRAKLEFIVQYHDPYLENSIAMEEVLKTSDFGNSSSYSDYDDSSYHEADEGQVSEKEKVPAFYRNSMNNTS